jgi:hypothetical protein
MGHAPFFEDPAWPGPPPALIGVNLSEAMNSDDLIDSIPEDVRAAAREYRNELLSWARAVVHNATADGRICGDSYSGQEIIMMDRCLSTQKSNFVLEGCATRNSIGSSKCQNQCRHHEAESGTRQPKTCECRPPFEGLP